MEISLGFLVVLIFVLFPGLLFRRFYYFGPFSRGFSTGKGIGGVIAASIIPGLILAYLSMLLYGYFFAELNLDQVIDGFKEINDPQFKRSSSNGTPFNDLVFSKVSPFLGFEYISSFLLGVTVGRLVRATRLDTKSALFRFKDRWFYLFSGERYKLQRNKEGKSLKGKHLFTKVEILSEFNDKTYLYSGYVVDYEVSEQDIGELSKVILRNAKRYCIEENGMSQMPIDGDLLVVDCSSMKNINLTYHFDDSKVEELSKRFLKSRFPRLIESTITVLSLALFPLFFFQSQSIQWGFYLSHFEDPLYTKIIFYLLTTFTIAALKPFVKGKEGYMWLPKFEISLRIIVFMILFLVWYTLHG